MRSGYEPGARPRGAVGAGTAVLIVAAGVLLIAALVFLYGLSARRNAIHLRNGTEAQVDVVQVHHDAMWKILTTKAGISGQYKPADYKELLAEAVEGRKGGALAKSIAEQNPAFDLSLLTDLSRSVEAEYRVVAREQKKLRDLDRQFRDAVQDPLGGLFLTAAQKEPIEYKLITSTRSRAAQESGVEDDVDLFKPR